MAALQRRVPLPGVTGAIDPALYHANSLACRRERQGRRATLGCEGCLATTRAASGESVERWPVVMTMWYTCAGSGKGACCGSSGMREWR